MSKLDNAQSVEREASPQQSDQVQEGQNVQPNESNGGRVMPPADTFIRKTKRLPNPLAGGNAS